MRTFILMLVCAAGHALPIPAAAQEIDWERAEREILRLPPSAFPALPAAIRGQLERMRCTIPQVFPDRTPHNVVRGRFAAPNQTDWAVLCSRNGQSEIVLFWGGPTRCPALDHRGPDRGWLQGIGEGKAGFSGQISAVDSSFIMTRYREYGGPKPPPLEHDGLDVAFVEKASVVRYCYKGKWLRLQGSD